VPDVVSITSFKISLPEETCHILKGACNVADVTIEKFIRAKKRHCREVSVPQTRISGNIGAIWNYCRRGGFIRCRGVTIRHGVQCSLVGSTRELRGGEIEVKRLGKVIRRCERSDCRHFDDYHNLHAPTNPRMHHRSMD